MPGSGIDAQQPAIQFRHHLGELGGNLHAGVRYVAFAAGLGAARTVALTVMSESHANTWCHIQPAADGFGEINLMQCVGPKQAVVLAGAGVVIAALEVAHA